jgi:hypothetical protein
MNASRKQLVDNLLTSCRQLESPDAGVEDAKAVGQWCSIMVGNMPVPWGPHTTEDAAVLTGTRLRRGMWHASRSSGYDRCQRLRPPLECSAAAAPPPE